MHALLLAPLFLALNLAPSTRPEPEPEPEHHDALFELLDQNSDGALDPYEALDVLRQLEEVLGDEPITPANLASLRAEQEQEEYEEVEDMLAHIDANGDGMATVEEMDAEMRDLGRSLDLNGDGVVEIDEAMEADLGDDFALEESDPDPDNRPARFQVADGVATMSGVINADTPAHVLRLIVEHPRVRIIEMQAVPGSIDDEANLRAATYIRQHGFQTVLRETSMVASGGTDFFLAGAERVVEEGAQVGIHSWGGPGFQGKDVPRDDPQHSLYLDYYEQMGIPAAFYWRTLEAAPAEDVHWMTEEELERFRFRTE